MWAVVKIFEDGMSVGLIEVYHTYKAALKAAIEEVVWEAEARELGPGEYPNPKTVLMDARYKRYIFSDDEEFGDCNEGCEYGKAVIIQIKKIGCIGD